LALPYSNISNLDIYRLTNAPLYKAGSLHALLADEAALEALGVRDRAACVTLYALLDGSVRVLREAPLTAAIEHIFSRSGALAYIMGQPDALATIDVIRAFFRYIKVLTDAHQTFALSDILDGLKQAREYRLSIATESYHRENAIRVMTVHRAKGMEFDRVFIPHMHDGLWGGRRNRERLALPLFEEMSDTAEDDERRLLYVAMTRARETLTFSYAKFADDGSAHVPSRFLEELKGHIKEEIITAPETPFFVVTPQKASRNMLSDEEKTVLRKRLVDQGLSVTALNNYLESPWKYFFMNLLRIPRPRAPHLRYGSAVDETLKWYGNKRKEGAVPDEASVLRMFRNALVRQGLTKKDLETYRTRGIAALTGYLAKYSDEWFVDTESAVS
ncbi:MAG: 3'-5' exonuclease, partial [Patescibacteria group bacterium]|nr:3'-5' exonuclease [Patescibacteria group bacterium]